LQLYLWVIFFSHIPYNYTVALELLQLQTVQVTRQHSAAALELLQLQTVQVTRQHSAAALELLQLRTVQ
jgi:hypothetical protein